MLTGSLGRVLSIQSHTVHGYVGNKSAVLPMQLLGLEVDPINSVQFSNHTGYGNGFTGQVLEGDDLDELVRGLQQNDITKQYTRMLTGYIGSATFLRKVVGVAILLRENGCKYYCDPVLGDKGVLYVPSELVEIYILEVLPLVSVLTPNQFELELLSGVKIHDLESLVKAFDKVHTAGVETIIVTSCEFSQVDSDSLSLFASTRLPSDAASFKRIKVTQKKQNMHFTGTGDLIAALILAW